ncbi:MAG: lipid II flippase MurJ, partial [Elusimicrobiota bacterium]
MSVNTRIAKAYVILITTSVIGHILSLFKEVMVAKYFGISNLMDAFYAALALPNLITGVIASAFGLVFLPIFVKYKTVNKEEGNRIAAIAVNYISLLLALTSVLLFIFAKQCVHYIFPGLDGNTAVITVKILKILSVTVFFTGIIGISTWILNAYEHFFAPSFSQIFITISILAFLFLFVDKLGVYVFAWGTVAGLAVQLVFILPFMKKEGYRHYWDFNLNHPAIEQAVKLSFFLVILNFISGLTPLINRIMASWLPTGSIAALAYADKLVQVPLIIFSGSIATAIYPFFAKQLAENKIDDMRDTLATSIKMTGFIFIPMAIILMILAKPIIQVLFQRGVFDEQATSITA